MHANCEGQNLVARWPELAADRTVWRAMLQGDLRLRVRTFAEGLLLLSPASHWAVLINTNGWYGYEELKSGWYMRYLHITNFERRLRTLRALAEPLFTAQLPGTSLHSLQRSHVLAGFREISKS